MGSKHKVDALNQIRLDLAQDRAINVFNLQKFVSPKGVYTDKIKGKPARDVDRSHFNEYGYQQITKWLVPQLEKLERQRTRRDADRRTVQASRMLVFLAVNGELVVTQRVDGGSYLRLVARSLVAWCGVDPLRGVR